MGAGLDRVQALPVGGGYVLAELGAAGKGLSGGWLAQVEAGWHPLAPVDLFAFGRAWGQLGPPEWQAGVGARVRW